MSVTLRNFYLIPIILAFSWTFGYAQAITDNSEQLSTLSDQKSVAVTIYSNFALVKDVRQVDLAANEFQLAWRDVSAQIKPETALLRSISHSGSITVKEQNFNFDLLTPENLLNKFIGKTVSVIKTNPATGIESKEGAQVLSTSDGIVLRLSDRIETGLPGRIVFDQVPGNLRDRPTLVIDGTRDDNAAQVLELSYLTDGLSWKADYVAELFDSDDHMDLSGWVTLTNVSGTSYPNAKLQLVAGDVNRVQREFAAPMALRAKAMADAAAAPMQQETLLEYHLYHLNRLTTIAENQTKQVTLLTASGIPATKELMLIGQFYYYTVNQAELGKKLKVDAYLQFDNKESSHLGVPLPQGIVRVYKRDQSGNAQFVGEDRIDHTPKNEKIRLKLGQSFDVTADKKQADFKQLSGSSNSINRSESAYEITLKNAKKEAVTVTVHEPIPGDWKIVEESLPHQKTSSNTATWKVNVAAESAITLTYRVQVKF